MELGVRSTGACYVPFAVGSVLAPAILSLLLVSFGAHAQSLQESMLSAYRFNPGLKAERARLEATNQGIPKARARFLPTVTGSYSAEYEEYKDRSGNGDYDQVDHIFQVNLSQPIFQGFSAVNRLNQSHEESTAGYNRLLNREQDLLFGTAQAYLAVVRDRAVLAHQRRYRSIVAQEHAAVRGRYSLGDATRTDIEQAAARLADAEATLEQVAGNLDISKAQYQRLVGTAPGKVAWPKIPKHLIPPSVAQAIDVAYANNPDIRSRIAGARAARYAARASAGDLLPNVSLESSYQKGYRDNITNAREDEFRVGFRISAPLFTGGSNLANVREAKNIAAQREYELDDTRLAIRESVVRASRQRTAASARAKASRRSIAANSGALKGLQIEYRGGQRTLLDVLNGQRELVDSRIAFEQARYDSMLAEFFLIASIGSLAPEHFSIAAERPAEIARLVPEFNDWDLRLAPRN
ncbi:MAG: TolC family outer membrane protein [Stappiaceae bacterium]